MDRIVEAEEESGSEAEDEEVTASQQVANEAVHLKKLEQKRKSSSN